MEISVEFGVRRPEDPGEVSYQFRLKTGDSIQVGRSQTADLVVNDRNMSRTHCAVLVSGSDLVLEDRSKNGTFLNGVKIPGPQVLHDGDVIQIGQSAIAVRMKRVEAVATEFTLVGMEFQGYRVESVIGSGNLGVVYKAHQEKMRRPVAIKTLAHRHQSNQGLIDRFLRMPRIAGQLVHPNIVQLYDSGFLEEHDLYYVVMEYVEGKSLTEVLKEQNRMPVEQAVPIFLQLGNALSFAARKNIVHRDVNPSNILVGDNHIVKLVGLGLAKSLESDMVALTQAGMAMGMIHYIPPEQIEDSSSVDHRSDIYSMGAVFYRVVCGEPPHGSGSKREFFEKMKRRDRPRPPFEVYPTIGRELSDIIMKCVEPDAKNRYPDAELFVQELRAATTGHTITRDALNRARSNLLAMFPAPREIPGYRIDAEYRPSEGIGGDFYDFFEIAPGRWVFLQGDVTGHGFEAAIVVGMAKTYLKIHARTGAPPGEVLAIVNREVYEELDRTTFLTVFYGVLDLPARTLTFARAGHGPLVRYNPKSSQPPQLYEPDGTILGMLDPSFFRIQEETIQVSPGDVLVVWTDGVNECPDGAGDEFGIERVVETIASTRSSNARKVIDQILAAVGTHGGKQSTQQDDITILAIEVME